jgi:nucleotide-binding universal stress UspA family protein
MFTNILLAVDGSEASLLAARHGIALARDLKAEIVVLTVTVPWAAYFSRELAVLVPDIVVPQLEYDRKRTRPPSVFCGTSWRMRDAPVSRQNWSIKLTETPTRPSSRSRGRNAAT